VTNINPHGQTIEFGKHKGELFTRLPVSYLKWMINEGTKQSDVAKAEFARRGDTMPEVELSGHAIDNASLRVRKIWHETRGQDEGLYSWLQRITLEALKNGEQKGDDAYVYQGMKLIICEGAEFPTLKTIMRVN
jgi:hypothetical protein